MTTMGLVHDYGGLLTVRWFLGLTEAGLFPGVNYYLRYLPLATTNYFRLMQSQLLVSPK
jgi:hypothetical protein